MKQTVGYAFGLGFLLLAAAACNTRPPAEPRPDRTPEKLVGAIPFPNPRSGNQRLANTVPGFGGAYFEGGVFHVYVTDLRVASSASPAVQAELSANRHADAVFEFVKGDYTFDQLTSFGKLLDNDMNGVLQDGVDSRHNKFLIVVRSEREIDRLKRAIAKLGLPLDAFILEIGEGAQLTRSRTLAAAQSKSPCVDPASQDALDLRHMVGVIVSLPDTVAANQRARLNLPLLAENQVTIVADTAVCRSASIAYDSAAFAGPINKPVVVLAVVSQRLVIKDYGYGEWMLAILFNQNFTTILKTFGL
jgi:hypothetical protein